VCIGARRFHTLLLGRPGTFSAPARHLMCLIACELCVCRARHRCTHVPGRRRTAREREHHGQSPACPLVSTAKGRLGPAARVVKKSLPVPYAMTDRPIDLLIRPLEFLDTLFHEHPPSCVPSRESIFLDV
jgi:hypothetical protein